MSHLWEIIYTIAIAQLSCKKNINDDYSSALEK